MSKFRIINLIDKLFVSVAIFLTIFAWVNFYIRSLWSTFIISLIFSAAIIYIIYYLLNKKQDKVISTKKRIDDINENFYAFKLLSKQQKMQLIKAVLSKEFETSIKNEKLTYIQDEKKHLVLFATHYDILKQNDLINLLDDNIIQDIDYIDIICNEMANLNTNIYKFKQIHIIDKSKLYDDYFAKNQMFPDKSELNLKATKISFKQILKEFFVPRKAKSYFFCGLILLFSSLILPYHTYYIIFGTLFMIFAVLCKLLPHFTK